MRIIILSSSVVEQSAVSRFVVGSIPTYGGAEYLVGLVVCVGMVVLWMRLSASARVWMRFGRCYSRPSPIPFSVCP